LALFLSFALQLRALSLGQRAIEGKRRLQQDKALQSFYEASQRPYKAIEGVGSMMALGSVVVLVTCFCNLLVPLLQPHISLHQHHTIPPWHAT
tara:strand:+ start:185 stop:463 length:279 start_codon:yes stop_codon:yes gene_type:complete